MKTYTNSQHNTIDLTAFSRQYYVERKEIKELARIHQCSVAQVGKIVRESLHSKRPYKPKYAIDEDFFEVIDTEHKAYFLGLLYADGSVTKTGVHITLQERDKHIIEELKAATKSASPIKFIAKHRSGDQNYHMITLLSKKLSNDVQKHGCFMRKSLILRWPATVPQHLLKHFIRGYFDGDGCFTFCMHQNRYVNPHFSIVGTIPFCKELFQFIHKNVGVNFHIQKPYKQDAVIDQVEIKGGKQVSAVMGWLYGGASIYLKRKYQKYQHYIQLVEASPDSRYSLSVELAKEYNTLK